MTDSLFANFKDYSDLITEINTIITKYSTVHSHLECFVFVKNKSESLSLLNYNRADTETFLQDFVMVKNKSENINILNYNRADAKAFLQDLINTFDSPTALSSDLSYE